MTAWWRNGATTPYIVKAMSCRSCAGVVCAAIRPRMSIDGEVIMKKTPTIFMRDWNGDRSLVTDERNPECQWVFDGEGIPTEKLDGTCCMIRDGKLYKRREIKPGQNMPPDFEAADEDYETGKIVGWVPVGDGPEDKWH